jgi:hypothetical protein
MKYQLIYPMVAYVFLIWALVLANFRTRVRAVRSRQVSIKYFKAFLGEPPPENVVIRGRHYDNQFQVPVLFLIGCVAHFAVGAADQMTLVLAWTFIATRLAHSLIHLGSNRLGPRVAAFGLGWLVLGIFYAQLAYFAYTLSGG